MHFDGVNDFVDIDDWSWGGAVSFEVFVMFSSFDSWVRVFDFADGYQDDNVILCLSSTDGQAYWVAYRGSSSNSLVFSGMWAVDTWVHAVVTIEETTMMLFKNGVLASIKSDGWEPYMMMRQNHWLGRSQSASHDYFSGFISYLRIWHGVALNETDVALLHDGRFGNCRAGYFGSGEGSCYPCAPGRWTSPLCPLSESMTIFFPFVQVPKYDRSHFVL
jgi:hypothetical protein